MLLYTHIIFLFGVDIVNYYFLTQESDANYANDDGSVQQPSSKKFKEEEDAAEKRRKKLIASYPKDIRNKTVLVNGKEKKCHDINHSELVDLMGKHNDPNNSFGLSKRQMRMLSISRELHTDGNGNDGVRLAYKAQKFEDNTKITGEEKERLSKNLNMWITNPDNGKK